MTWFVFAILTAIFTSLLDVTSKHGLKTINVYVVSWSLITFTLPLLLPILFFIDIPDLGNHFGVALLVSGSLNVIAIILYIKAIKVADLSITVPLITFTPLFLLATSPLIVQEYPTVMDAIGIVLIVAGSYTLKLNEKEQGYFDPFKSLFREKGPKLMLLVAFIWSITANVDKIGVQNSSPTFWAIANYSFIATAMTPILLYKAYNHLKQIPQNLIPLIPIGLFHAMALLFQMQAIDMTIVAHVISIKRISVFFSVLLGHFIFHEEGIKERSIGAAIMIVGVVFITL
ncbi:MAG: EamA family transporter [Coleofasciculus sp. G1-WW12-02]|uniref:EamA family transporter n=1 Tax=Coleofasciculus sp. G1-WW12-02 TaxID=3068483 RepID=UPI003301C084